MKRIISLILSIAVLFSVAVIPQGTVFAADTVVKKIDFNDMTDATFATFKGTLVAGGVYNLDNATLESSVVNGGSGKSLKMGGIEKVDNRIKFKELFGVSTFSAAQKGKKYTATVSVYSPKATKIRFGSYSESGTANAFSPFNVKLVEIPANAWTTIKLGVEVDDKLIAAGINQIGICQVGSSSMSDTLYIDDIIVTEGSLPPEEAKPEEEKPAETKPAETKPTTSSTSTGSTSSNPLVKSINFDSMTTITDKEVMGGGGYKISSLKISTQYDHTSGKGKSLQFGERGDGAHRIKFIDMFNADGIGETFDISAWVYSASADTTVLMGLYSTVNTDYAMSPLKSVNAEVKKGVWTEIKMEYEHTNDIITQLGIQPAGTTEVFIDDIYIAPQGLAPVVEDVKKFPNIPDEYEKIAETFSALGFIENFLASFDEKSEITREEFAGVLAEFLPNDASKPANTKFSDVTSSNQYSGAIDALSSIGVLKGDETGAFRPSDKVASEEAIAALISFIGYEVYAAGRGGYPSGYLSTASRIGLTDGVAITVGKPITHADLLVMMYNFIKIDILEESEFGTVTKYKTEEGKTILAKNFDIYYDEGRVVGTSKTMISSLSNLAPNQTVIDSKTYKYENINMSDYIGYQIDYYYKDLKNTTMPIVLYASPSEGANKIIKILPDQYSDVRDSKLYYYVDGSDKEKSIKLLPSQNMIYNGVYKPFDTSLLDVEEGNLIFLDADNDGNYEVVFVNDIYYLVVSSVDKTNEIIYDKYDSSKNIEFDSNDSDNILEIYNAAGQKIDISSLKEWDVLSVTKSDGGRKILNVIMNRQTVKGTISAITKDDDGYLKTIKIKDKYYEVSETFKKMFTEVDDAGNIVAFNPQLNDDVVLYLSHLGTVVTYEANSTRAGKLGYLFECELPDEANPRLKMTILTEDKKFETYSIAEKVFENGDRTSVSHKTITNSGKYFNAATGDTNRQVIMYKLNADNEINKLWHASALSISDVNNLTELENNQIYNTVGGSSKVYYSAGPNKLLYTKKTGLMNERNYMLSDKFIVFTIPTLASNADDKAYYSVGNASSLNSDDAGMTGFTGYSVSGDVNIVDFAVRTRDAYTSNSSATMAVNEVSNAINDEGDEVLLLTGLVKGEEKSVMIEDNRTSKRYEITPGDIITYEKDTAGRYVFTGSGYSSSSIIMYVDYIPSSDKKFNTFQKTSSSTITTRGRTMRTFAIPYKYEDGILHIKPCDMTTKPIANEENPNLQLFRPSAFANIYVFDTTKNQFRTGSADDIITAVNDPVNYTPIWMHSYENSYKLLVIYK